MRLAVVLLGLAAALLWGYLVGTITPQVYNDNQAVMQAVCNYSRSVRSGDWEDACGLAQSVSGEDYPAGLVQTRDSLPYDGELQPAIGINFIQPTKGGE